MKLRAIGLSWFRGAASHVSLDLAGKSAVIYGANGAGKSSFVDAVEYAINDGTIRHLSHEYSGKRQEKAVRNTHTPEQDKSKIKITFDDGSELELQIDQNGAVIRPNQSVVATDEWTYRSTILRQDEVAEFITGSKGEKYSALLPLLGLDPLETAAKNLHQLARAVQDEVGLTGKQQNIRIATAKRKSVFGDDSDADLVDKLCGLHAAYCTPQPDACIDVLANELVSTLTARISTFTSDQRYQLSLLELGQLDLRGPVSNVRECVANLADAMEPLLEEKLDVLRTATTFSSRLDGTNTTVECPGCGRPVEIALFHDHISAERARLASMLEAHNRKTAALQLLCSRIQAAKLGTEKSELEAWRGEIESGPLAENLHYLSGLGAFSLQHACSETDLQNIERLLIPLIDSAIASSASGPIDVQTFASAKQTAESAMAALSSTEDARFVARATDLLAFITALEDGVRDEIRQRALTVVAEITSDIQSMWRILNPGEEIEEVKLYLPDADKAIDVGLKFHGVDQYSPRLTLSEGNRNSLGLCIFLSMAKRGAKDCPLLLDDVIVSLDREHRGMVAEVIRQHFADRQVVIFTHDRDWFTDLRQQLDGSTFKFRMLLPYESPSIGIRWTDHQSTFSGARAQIAARPDAAANDARKIMDIELAGIAQRLKLRLAFCRGDKNDKRMALEFIQRLIGDRNMFSILEGSKYVQNQKATTAFEKAKALLLTWANRGSHTYDVTKSEATQLIDVCDAACAEFDCSSCKSAVWAVALSDSCQCRCGILRWKYP